MDTISLSAATTRVGKSVRFVAAVQQIATGKRVLLGRQRVQSYHVLHVGDAGRQFFKVTCWGETPPTLIHSSSTSESNGDSQLSNTDAVLRVGDIVLFSACIIKSFRGDVAAQFIMRNDEEATSSTVQLLYRKDRYFSTQDVPLKDLYPMIEWYKQHCREFIEQNEDTTTATEKKRKNRTTIKDLRENMVASVVCKLRVPKRTDAGASGSGDGEVSELDGVLLCELIMYDSPKDVMSVNLWDQHAERRFVTRLLEHHGAVGIDGIVISLQALSNRLLANTTPHTTFRLIAPNDSESVELEKRIAGFGKPPRPLDRRSGSISFSTVEELKACVFESQVTLKNVRIEQVCLGRHFGHESRVLANFTPHLAEKYCTGCDQTLPEIPGRDGITQTRFGTCVNRCKTRRGSTVDAPCAWRYRRFSMILRDARNERIQVDVGNQATVEMVGNIEAQLLVQSCSSKDQRTSKTQFDVASAVASLVNALVEDPSEMFKAQLACSSSTTSGSSNQTPDSYQYSIRDEDFAGRRVFSLVSLSPNDAISI
ncbi:hypothetical protein P3T76_000300 [Phytophthora citrophthora]|uniref:Uncharacterized protein n=1 Tax=Phytophthora citrophthora TaxID=4793 RepID=A0AAD9GZP4_9STRA|nr:hypothetical protein P3T76_000300 [Phytophthora citrophthora]